MAVRQADFLTGEPPSDEAIASINALLANPQGSAFAPPYEIQGRYCWHATKQEVLQSAYAIAKMSKTILRQRFKPAGPIFQAFEPLAQTGSVRIFFYRSNCFGYSEFWRNKTEYLDVTITEKNLSQMLQSIIDAQEKR
jgi:hypothetical protein